MIKTAPGRSVRPMDSLATRLVLVIGGLLVGTALVLSAIVTYLLGMEQDRATQSRLSTGRQTAESIVEEHVTSVARVARAAALDSAVQDAAQSGDARAAAAAIERYLAIAPDTAIALLDRGRNVLAGTMPATLRTEAMLAAPGSTPIVSGIARGDACNILAVAAMPVAARGTAIGRVVVTAEVNPDLIDRLHALTGLGAWTYCLAGPDAVTVGARGVESSPALRSAVIEGQQVALVNSVADGVEGYGYHIPLVDVERQSLGMMAVTVPTAEIAAARDRAVKWFSTAALLLAGLVLIEAVILSRVITRPLQTLMRATEAMQAGDLSQPIVVKGRDEISALAASFDMMRERLALIYADLEHERNRYRDFLAMVPHEFKTPLAAMGASLELLEASEESLPPADRGLLASVRRSVIRLQQLIENLLDSASLQSGQFQVRAVPSDMQAIMNEAQAYVMPLLDQRRQPLRVAASPGLPPVMADPRRVAQVLVNLLSNANKYAPAGEPVDMTASTAGDFVRVAVADHGPGILPERRAQLFQRFARLGAEGPDHPPGIGLGLAMVSEIIRLHGGQAGIADTEGGGATFWFTLPVARSDSDGA